MLDKIKHIISFNPSSVAGIHVEIIQDREIMVYPTIVKKKKDELVIEKKIPGQNRVYSLKDKITSLLPVVLSFGGKGLMIKKVKSDEALSPLELLQKSLPNASEKDFYYQVYPGKEGEYFVSIIRASIVNWVVEQLREIKLYAVELYLGPFALNNIISLTSDGINELVTASGRIVIEQNKILHIHPISKNEIPKGIYISNDYIEPEYILPACGAISFFIASNRERQPSIISGLHEEFRSKHFITKAGMFILLLFFSLLLVNFLFFNHYNSLQADLAYQLEKKQEYARKIELLRNEIQAKENFIKNNLNMNSLGFSYFADRLAYIKNEGIMFSRMAVQPVDKNIKEGKEIELSHKLILLTGQSQNSIMLNNWIKDIKTETWVDEVKIVNYKQDNLNSQGEFILEIIIK